MSAAVVKRLVCSRGIANKLLGDVLVGASEQGTGR